MSETRILIFDSGVGGISVFKDIKARLPWVSCTYAFDNEAYPYGELDPNELVERVELYVNHFIETQNISLVVIACNTASTIVLPRLREKIKIPIVGVVPAIKPASQCSSLGVGLIATPATVTREYTHELIRHFASDKDVVMVGTTKLVDMAEQKLRGVPVDLKVLDKVLKPLQTTVDVAVLGCTHFPLLRDEIREVLGSKVLLVDSGDAISRRVEFLLQNDCCEKGIDEVAYDVYCSAEPYDRSALQLSFTQLGFSNIKIHPLQDA
ncbi:glutamate racemase [Vibrio sp. UCD-FRSSP16_10]|uniref:glutamate racemase n=1 Tax=unclassified Vibrio TaxID=2614977 RepID=UPI0007FE5015|nr:MULTISPECIES: glutamate racemase [unclassified Vibrio]OBT12954.1 glutamate racemase [Vibrio sp. UCD-FRSSP16_30]OBT19199.1 glutamate racemase [Vibrio sp. UCD-FRSSP16_10]